MRRRLLTALATAVALLAIPGSAMAAINVTRAELSSGQLRVEGGGAVAGAMVSATSDSSTASAGSDSSGAFRVQASSFRSSDCQVTVSDGVSSAVAKLSGCTASTGTTTPTTTTTTPATTTTTTTTPTSTLAITDDSLPRGTLGVSYTGFLFSNGGRGTPYRYSIASGSLPPGLSMTDYGVQSAAITGTPKSLGTFTFTVRVKDGSGATATKTFSIVVDPTPPLSLAGQSDQLNPAFVGASYIQNLFVSGGAPAYSWSIAAGALPPGLTLSRNGSITGTPTTAGTFGFTVRVVDSRGSSVSRALSIVVSG